MTERGYIALARGVLDHPVVGARKPYADSEAWLWLLFEAAWKARRIRVRNGRTVVALEVERGQLSYSRSYLASAWGWSEKRVRTFLNRLKMDLMIVLQTGQLQTVITICNYETYQNRDVQRGQQTGQQTGRQWAGNGPETEEGKKERKDNTRFRAGEPEGFAEWYGVYPRKKQRKDAERAFAKLMKAGEISRADLMARTLAFTATWSARPKADLEYCPYPASWLNSGEYLDTPELVASGGNNGSLKIEEPTRRDPRTFTESDWHDCLTAFKGQGRWPETYWGPPPGQPGCLVPGRLLVAPAEPTRTTGAANG